MDHCTISSLFMCSSISLISSLTRVKGVGIRFLFGFVAVLLLILIKLLFIIIQLLFGSFLFTWITIWIIPVILILLIKFLNDVSLLELVIILLITSPLSPSFSFLYNILPYIMMQSILNVLHFLLCV